MISKSYDLNHCWKSQHLISPAIVPIFGTEAVFLWIMHLKSKRYSWWSYRAGARSKNIGWRIDYFLVSEAFLPLVKNAFIQEEITGSDHCPVGIGLNY